MNPQHDDSMDGLNTDEPLDYDDGFDDGYIAGRADGRMDAYEEAYEEVSEDYAERISLLYVEILEMQARVGVLERKLGARGEEGI